MDYPHYPAYRSASMPNSNHPPRTSPFNAPPKRDSDFMMSEGPITPPLSPGHSEDEEPISVDPEPRYSGPSPNTSGAYLQPQADTRRASREMLQTEERMEVDTKRMSNSPRAPPARHLEDEKSHLEENGTLKLTDFEVKGTLGTLQSLYRRSQRYKSTSRNGDLCSRSIGQAARLNSIRLSKLLCSEDSSQIRNCPLETSRACQCRTLYPVPRSPSFYRRPLRHFPGQPQHIHADVLRTGWRTIHTFAEGPAVHTGCYAFLSGDYYPCSQIPTLFQHHLSRLEARKPPPRLPWVPTSH